MDESASAGKEGGAAASDAPREPPSSEGRAGDDGESGNSELKKRAVRGGVLEMGGFALSQLIRFGSNLLLTRLLFPEAFGLMTTVTVINTGLIMLSDVGIEQSVIRSERGDDPTLLRTAWSIQILRGLGLYVVALLATYPLGVLLQDSRLLWLIPVTSLDVLIAGFGSTAEFTFRRGLRVGRILALDLGVQLVAFVVMASWAYLDPSVWALAGGVLVRELVRAIATHFVFPVDYRLRFELDPEARQEIVDFGKWILFSSAVFFLAGSVDRPLLMRFIGAAGLGVYTIAALLSEAAFTVIGKVSLGVLYPVLGQVRLQGPESLRTIYYEARLRLDALSMFGVGLLATVGPWGIDLLWDERYHEAGWMLQLLCVKAASRSIFDPAEKLLMAMGHVRVTFANNLLRTIVTLVAVPVGYATLGMKGAVLGVALTDVSSVFILWGMQLRVGVLRIERELLALVFLAVSVALGYGLSLLLALLPV